jgi:acyl-coenzyme A synthetase/AMP-(fatty) acid ligase
MLGLLARARARWPDRVAVRSGTPDGGWAATTWAQLHDAARSAAARAAPLGAGAPVVLVVDGTADSIATAVGLVAAGVDTVLLEEHSSYLGDPASPVHAAGPRLVIGPPGTGDVSYGGFRAPAGAPLPAGAPRPGEILQLTSGSTGEPRIARQTLPNALTGGRLYRRLFGMSTVDTVLVAVPVAHSYGLAGLCSALLSGATLVTLPRFGLRTLVAGLDAGATVLLGTPLLYRLLAPVRAAHGPPPRLRVALSAGGPMPEDTTGITAALGTPVRQIYGTTEVGLIACVPSALAAWPPGSVGFPAPGVTLRLREGRLAVRTPMMFRGYVGGDRPFLTPDGFYDSGDLARVDPGGHLFVVGRKEGVVNVGGRKVSPARIERLLLDHPGVRDAAVFGVERPDHEQEMHAALVLGAGTDVGAVLAYCRSRSLRPYEVPHRVHVLDRLPRNGMGKVDRHRLREAVRS